MSRMVGPALPPHLRRGGGEEESAEEDTVGPALPPTDEGSSSEDDYMPALPPGYRAPAPLAASAAEDSSDESDSGTVGPRPAEMSAGGGSAGVAAREVEERARRMKDRLEGKEEVEVKRESWMLELPEDKANKFGLGPRQFSRKGHLGPEKKEKNSAWTDSPQEKARKAALGIVEGEEEEEVDVAAVVAGQRDQAMELVAAELRQKRGTDSLMDMHDKKLNKKKKKDVEEGEVKERRPFDRDLDLQANQFDAAAKKAMLKKAAKINDRFSAGAQKFL